MGVIKGNLVTDLPLYHSPDEAELAVVVIDEKTQWHFIETDESARIRREAQQVTLQSAKALACRVITIDMPRRESPHIEDAVGKPDISIVKTCFGTFEDKASKRLLDYLQNHHVTSLLVMGGNVDHCVHCAIAGSQNHFAYPGFLSYGYTVLTSPKLLSPYRPQKYSMDKKFQPDARFYSEQDSFPILTHPFCKTNIVGEWPLFTLHAGVRIYTDI